MGASLNPAYKLDEGYCHASWSGQFLAAFVLASAMYSVGGALSQLRSQLALEDHPAKPMPKAGVKVSMSEAQAQRAQGKVRAPRPRGVPRMSRRVSFRPLVRVWVMVSG